MNLSEIQQAFSPLTEIGKGTKTFTISGLSVTIRTLLPSEEIETHKIATSLLGDGDESHTLEYINSFQQSILSYSILKIGSLDFEGVEFVATGELTPQGTPIQIPVNQAVRKVLSTLSRPVFSAIYKKYTELEAEMSAEAATHVLFDPVDIENDINILESRLLELKKIQEKAKEENKNSVEEVLSKNPRLRKE